MKRLFLILTLLITTCTVAHASAMASQDLKFTPESNGKFIFCNNNEALYRNSLADDSSETPRYIMSNDNLTTDKYSLFASHMNHTELKDESGTITGMGFDIEVDVQFKANTDSTLVIDAVGYDIQKPIIAQDSTGTTTLKQSPLDLTTAWTNYLQMPIYTLGTNEQYFPEKFTPVTIHLKAGESKWLSEYISNYSTIPCLKAVHILSDFTIQSGNINVNVAALKHNGKLRDRSQLSKNVQPGIYTHDNQYKGIADTLPSVNASLDYTIDDSISDGTYLPVKVYNQYTPNGNKTTKWYTNVNPQEDEASRSKIAESDMLTLLYKDNEKLQYYSDDVDNYQKNNLWIFDVYHSDTYETENGIPNYTLSTDTDNRGIACNIGNYGVSTNYTVTIINKGKRKRYLNYQLNTSSANLVIVKDKDGKPLTNYVTRKKSLDSKELDTMASLELPAGATTTYTICVILPPNGPGGMENSMKISSEQTDLVYDNSGSISNLTNNNTGKEYYRWDNKNLYVSEDGTQYVRKNLPEDTAAIFDGNWENFDIEHFDNLYVARLNSYDGSPYFCRLLAKFCNKVYYMDEKFNLLTTQTFETFPTKVYEKDGKIITVSGGREYSTELPNLEKTITVRLNGQYIDFDVTPTIESSRTYVPIRALFEALNAKVEWDDSTKTAKVTSKDSIKLQTPTNEVASETQENADSTNTENTETNAEESSAVSEPEGTTIEFTINNNVALVNGKATPMEVPAKITDERTLIPLRFMSETLGYKVTWNEDTRTIDISTVEE